MKHHARQILQGCGISALFFLMSCGQVGQPSIVQADQSQISSTSEDSLEAQATGQSQGLMGEYFDNIDFTGVKKTRLDSTINSNWKTGSPISGIQPTSYSVKWNGQIIPTYSEAYTFYLTSSGRVKLIINGQIIINNWNSHSNAVDTRSISLEANTKYDVRLEYAKDSESSALKLEWKSKNTTRRVVPSLNFSPIGNNLQAALDIVRLNSKIASSGIQFDINSSIVSSSSYGQFLIAREVGKTNFILAGIDSGAIKFLFKEEVSQGNAQFTDLITGRTVNLGALNQFYNVDYSQNDSQKFAFAKIISSVIAISPESLASSINGSASIIKTQGISPTDCFSVPPPCGNACVDFANSYSAAECNYLKIGWAPIGPVIGCLATAAATLDPAGCIPGAIGGAAPLLVFLGIDALKALRERDAAWFKFQDCLMKHQECLPKLSYSPKSMIFKLKTPENQTKILEIHNDSMLVNLDYAVRTDFYSLQNSFTGRLSPGDGRSHDIYYQCSNNIVNYGKIAIYTLIDNTQYIIDVILDCTSGPRIASEHPNPIIFTGPVKSYIRQNFKFINAGNENLSYYATDGITDYTDYTSHEFYIDKRFRYESVAPNTEATVDITTTCPNRRGSINGVMTVKSTDPSRPEIAVPMVRNCTLGPAPMPTWVSGNGQPTNMGDLIDWSEAACGFASYTEVAPYTGLSFPESYSYQVGALSKYQDLGYVRSMYVGYYNWHRDEATRWAYNPDPYFAEATTAWQSFAAACDSNQTQFPSSKA